MILVDPQCGVTAFGLAAVLEVLSPGKERDALVLPGGERFELVFASERRGGREVRTASVTGSGTSDRGIAMEEVSAALGEDLASGVLQECRDYLRELAEVYDEAGEASPGGGFWIQSALTALAVFRRMAVPGRTFRSLPAGVGAGMEEDGARVTPLPCPTVLEVARRYAFPVRGLPGTGRRSDAAGLLLLARLSAPVERLPSIVPGRQVYGAGVGGSTVRAMELREAELEEVWLVEAALDDATGEEMGRAIEQIQEAALEAHVVQGIGKKGRPLYLLRALARGDQLEAVLERYFRDTPTIGVRYWPVGRFRMQRAVRDGELLVDGCRLPTRVKISRLGDILKGKAEADDIGRYLRTPKDG
ncbi:MAG: LarC family nickel insertion protein [Synergistales bacterium]|nr:LarC family nickel insertion protein [Synergistales bacterium]